MSQLVFVSFGSSLGDRVGHCLGGLSDLAALPGLTLEVLSSLYETAPLGLGGRVMEGGWFVNGVASFRCCLRPGELMRALLGVELRHGRRRDLPGRSRTLDLDILLYGRRRLRRPDLNIPHPRLAERRFVLVPLAEVGGRDLRLPGLGLTVGQALDRLPVASQPLRPLRAFGQGAAQPASGSPSRSMLDGSPHPC